MRSLVIVPAYNEQALVGQVVAEIRRHGLSVVVVDDGSTDATAARALAAGATVLRHCVNRGQGAALQTGITFAIAQQVDALVTFDADGQQDAEQIQAVLRWRSGLAFWILTPRCQTRGGWCCASRLPLPAGTLVCALLTCITVFGRSAAAPPNGCAYTKIAWPMLLSCSSRLPQENFATSKCPCGCATRTTLWVRDKNCATPSKSSGIYFLAA